MILNQPPMPQPPPLPTPAQMVAHLDRFVRGQGRAKQDVAVFEYSNTDNIQANLHYLDYRRLKEAWDKRPTAE